MALKTWLKRGARVVGLDVFRASPGFRWSHTAEDYYPIAPRSRWAKGTPPYDQLYSVIEQRRSQYEDFIAELERCADLLYGVAFAPDTDAPSRPCWNNMWFSGVDAAALVTFMAWKKPPRYVEIGSGFSTSFARYAIDQLGLDTQITSIDPKPRQEIDRICHEVVRLPLESCDLRIFDQIEPGDIVFFDGSHRVFSNSDASVFFLEVMPRLKPGVIVHIHDIALPDDYPEVWSRRLYNEQYALAAMLLCGRPPFRILAPIAFMCRDSALSESIESILSPPGRRGIPLAPDPETPNGSFWVEMTRV